MLIPRGHIAYPYDTSELLANYIKKYKKTHKKQPISFRDVVSWLKYGERATHYIHSYPGKIIPHIVHFFLAAYSYFPINSIVLDPFSGTGTVALESLLSGRTCYFADSNPLARLITSVKTHLVDTNLIMESLISIKELYNSDMQYFIPDVRNINFWYNNNSIIDLSKIATAIESVTDLQEKDFFSIAFSTIARKVSYADPRLSVPVRRKNLKEEIEDGLFESMNIYSMFEQQVNINCTRQKALGELHNGIVTAECVGNDARSLTMPCAWNYLGKVNLPDNSVDFIITSPPYAGAQKYIRATSLNLGWLSLSSSTDLMHLEKSTIGSERIRNSQCKELKSTGIKSADAKIRTIFRKNPPRAIIVENYIIEMKKAIIEMKRVLKIGGYILFIIGNNSVSGEVFESSKYFNEYFQKSGFELEVLFVDEIKSRGLMTKRNKTASIITLEWIMLLRKKV
jgi:tRNA G10  N-methylase Trm11